MLTSTTPPNKQSSSVMFSFRSTFVLFLCLPLFASYSFCWSFFRRRQLSVDAANLLSYSRNQSHAKTVSSTPTLLEVWGWETRWEVTNLLMEFPTSHMDIDNFHLRILHPSDTTQTPPVVSHTHTIETLHTAIVLLVLSCCDRLSLLRFYRVDDPLDWRCREWVAVSVHYEISLVLLRSFCELPANITLFDGLPVLCVLFSHRP